MAKDKTGRPQDIPISSALKPAEVDFERRAPIIPPGAVTYIYSGEFRTTTKTASFTLSNEMVVLVDATACSITLTLPAASSNANKVYYIKKVDTTSHVVTIKGDSSSETIDGEVEVDLTLQYQYIMVICDGTEWFILGGEYVKVDELLRAILNALNEINETTKKTQKELEDINS